jgi:hypothetical protein
LLIVCLGCVVLAPSGPGADDQGAGTPPDGRTFRVATALPQAADANDGSAARPWRTLARAVEAVGPGDTVLVHGGLYREAIRLEKSGTGPEQMITFRGVPGETVIVSGAEVLMGWARTAAEPQRAIWEAEWRWPGVFPSMVTADGQVLTPLNVPAATEELRPPKAYCQYFVGFGRGQAAMVPGSFFFDEVRNRLLVWLKADGDPSACTVEAAVRAPWSSSGSYLRVEGLRFRYAPLVVPVGGIVFTMAGPGGGLAPADGCVVRDCEVSLGAFEGMYVRGGARVSTVVEDCWVHHNGNGCGGFEGHGAADSDAWLVVRRCRFTDNNLFRWNSSWHAGGKHFGTRVFFDECEFARSHYAPGLWFDCKQRDGVVNRCYAHDNGQFGLYYEIGETGAFLSNVVEGHPNCCAVALNGSSRCLVAHNLIKAPERGIIVGWEGNVEGQVARVTCHNALWNNLLLGSDFPLITISPERDIACGNRSDHNLLWLPGKAPMGSPEAGWALFEDTYAAETKATLAQWRERRGLDLASRVADPQVTWTGGELLRPGGSVAPTGGKRLTREAVEEVFALKPMPKVGSEVVSASIADHRPPTRAFLDLVTALLHTPDAAAVPLGPLPPREAVVERGIPLVNAGFEVPKLEGAGARGPVHGAWEACGAAGAVSLVRVRDTGLWNWYPPDGDQVLALTASGTGEATCVRTVLPGVLRPTTRYTLRLWVGQPLNQAALPWPQVSVTLAAGPQVAKTQEVPEPRIGPHYGVWVEHLLVLETPPAVPRDAELSLELRRSAGSGAEVCFDRLRLASSPIPPLRLGP